MGIRHCVLVEGHLERQGGRMLSGPDPRRITTVWQRTSGISHNVHPPTPACDSGFTAGAGRRHSSCTVALLAQQATSSEDVE